MHRILLIIFLLLTAVRANPKYPADSLLTSDSLNIIQKVGVLPIALWQRLSFNIPGAGCQFYPCCSHYGAQAIGKHGLLLGCAVTADRIVRCNPFAWQHQLQMGGELHTDGRLVDPVIPAPPDSIAKTGKSPLLAAAMSAVIPGSGRVYAGRPWDGLMGFLTVALMANGAWLANENGSAIEKGIFIPIAAIFYSGEIYGAWRTAKYYYPHKQARQRALGND